MVCPEVYGTDSVRWSWVGTLKQPHRRPLSGRQTRTKREEGCRLHPCSRPPYTPTNAPFLGSLPHSCRQGQRQGEERLILSDRVRSAQGERVISPTSTDPHSFCSLGPSSLPCTSPAPLNTSFPRVHSDPFHGCIFLHLPASNLASQHASLISHLPSASLLTCVFPGHHFASLLPMFSPSSPFLPLLLSGFLFPSPPFFCHRKT